MAGRDNDKSVRIAADVGGTFTDIVTFDAKTGAPSFGKTLTTPLSIVEGILTDVRKADTAFGRAGLFLHGTTVAINTILERNGARTALITTRGFRDIYEIGRINRPEAYNLFFTKHDPLIPRSLRFAVDRMQQALVSIGTEARSPSMAAVMELSGLLEKTDAAGLFEQGLHEFLGTFLDHVSTLHDALQDEHFEAHLGERSCAT